METETTFIEALLGNESSIGEYGAFLTFAVITMALVKLVRYNNNKKRLKEEGTVIKFDKITWLEDNSLDVIITFITAFFFIRFLPDLGARVTTAFGIGDIMDKMLYGVVIGGIAQYVWHRILNNVVVTKK